MHKPKPIKLTHLDALDTIISRHFRATQAATPSVAGRSLPLLYTLVSRLASPPHRYAVLVIDLDGRFDPTRLTCSDTDARHVYLQRPSRLTSRSSTDRLRAVVAAAENFMLYGAAAHPEASAARSWWGTIVIGAHGAGDLAATWRGWLRVDREPVQPFPLGSSAEEALTQRPTRQAAVDAARWAATSPWGSFLFP